jgi:hypothetical protein
MKVTNIIGTSQDTCRCGSWLKHRENYSGRQSHFCAVETCARTDIVGAHVQKHGTADRNWYITPLCVAHNGKQDAVLSISAGYPLVSANVADTCGAR